MVCRPRAGDLGLSPFAGRPGLSLRPSHPYKNAPPERRDSCSPGSQMEGAFSIDMLRKDRKTTRRENGTCYRALCDQPKLARAADTTTKDFPGVLPSAYPRQSRAGLAADWEPNPSNSKLPLYGFQNLDGADVDRLQRSCGVHNFSREAAEVLLKFSLLVLETTFQTKEMERAILLSIIDKSPYFYGY